MRSADSFSPQGWGERVTVARESESASGDEVIQPGDHPRPQMFCTECSGEHLVDMIDEGQWSVSYTQASFAMGDGFVIVRDTKLKGNWNVV